MRAGPDAGGARFGPAREIALGPRGLVKANAALLPLAGALAAAPEGGRLAGVAALGLLGAVACWSQACILANDRADRVEDRAAGKARWIAAWPPRRAGVFIGLVMAAGLALSAAAGGPAAAAVYLTAAALGLAYSLPPIALKRRGAWGHFGYAGSGALAFAGLAAAGIGLPPYRTALLAAAVFLDKWVNLDFHQVVDHAADARAGSRTLAVRTGLARSRARLRAEALAAAAVLAAAAAAVLRHAGRAAVPAAFAAAAAFVLAALHARRARGRRGEQRLLDELPAVYLAASLAALRVTPTALLVLAAGTRPEYAPLAIAAVALVALELAQAARYRYC